MDSDPLAISDAVVLRDRPTNLLIVSVDATRRDRINHYGYAERVTTPTLDGLLEQGVTLHDHRSCASWTLPSFTCVLTGRDQISNGFWPGNSEAGALPSAPDDVVLLAEVLSAAGFHTMLSGASGFLGESSNMDQGHAAGVSRFFGQGGAYVTGAQVVSDAQQLMVARPSDVPWMLHVHLLDPHMPYNPPDTYLDELDELPETQFDLSTKDGTLALWRNFPELAPVAQQTNLAHLAVRYDASIRYTDDQIGALLDWLDARGDLDDTLVLLVSDHGEEFWEHDNFNHGYTAYDEVTASMAALWWPPGLEPAVVTTPTDHTDLAPTVLAILDVPAGDMTGQVIGTGPPIAHTLTWRADNKTVQSVTDGQHKLIVRWDGIQELYDLDADPSEQDPLPVEGSPLWDALTPEIERLDALVAETPAL